MSQEEEIDSLYTTIKVHLKQRVEGERERWVGKYDFLLSLIGFSVGLGNIWRFPYLCFKNGGGAFLIPYFITLFLSGLPVLAFELAIGQLSSSGCISAWKLTPKFRGIGIASTVILFFLNSYYIVVLAWAIYYFVQCFIPGPLMWESCSNDYNTLHCFSELHKAQKFNTIESVSSTNQYFNRHLLEKSPSISDIGSLRPGLVLSLLIAWCSIYLVLFKGVKLSGKVVWFTSLFPYVVLIFLVVRGVTLPGSKDGLAFYLEPDFSSLFNAQVWNDAVTQIFFSYSIGLGGLIALGSYNRFKTNCIRHAMIFASVNSITSVVGGAAIFSMIGFMAHEMGKSVTDVADKGVGLIFEVYPFGLSTLDYSRFWIAAFFLMIFVLGIDSQFVGVEGFITAYMDAFPTYFYSKNSRSVFLFCICATHFFIGLIFVTQGGFYTFSLFNDYAASGLCLLIITICESIGISFYYFRKSFYDDVAIMIGYKPNIYFNICWTIVTPLFNTIVLFFVFKNEIRGLFVTDYPWWATCLGLFLAFSSVVCIPFAAIWSFIFEDETSYKFTINKGIHNT